MLQDEKEDAGRAGRGKVKRKKLQINVTMKCNKKVEAIKVEERRVEQSRVE
jgi:hypothetical protein